MGFVLGIDVSTTATKAVLIDEAGAVRGIGVAEYDFDVPRPLWSEQDPALWWDGTAAAIRSVLASTGVAGDDDRGDRPDRPDARRRPPRRGGRGAAPRDPLERPAHGRRVRRDPRPRVGPERLVAITGNDALTGFTAPKLVWVRDHEPDVWRRIAHVLLPKDYVRLRLTGEYALDKADGAGTLLFDLAARDWSPEVLAALGIDPAWMPPTFEGPEITGQRVTAAAADATGLRAGTPVVAGGGDQAANAVGVGCGRARHRWPCRSGPPASSSPPRTGRSSSRTGECTPSATRFPAAGTSCR